MAERSPAQASPAVFNSNTNTKRPQPPILKKTSCAANANSSTLLGSLRKDKVSLETGKPDEMAACFLQYCATCEKQITTPCNSILYCSENCARKDSKKPLSAANIMSTSPSPPVTPSSPRPILQPRTPTGVSTGADVPISRIPADSHSYRPDLDPTEWKPKATRNARPALNRYNSEAFRYLSSFHRAINKNNDHNDNGNPGEIKIDVPNISAVAATAPTTPSLGNTPTTTASSWSISTSAGYDYNTRPLMPRHNRWYSTSVVGSAGVDLVTPHIPPPSANDYAKTDVMLEVNKPRGGLGTFFGARME